MRDWGLWEWAAYGALSLSIIGDAIEQLRKRWPEMSIKLPSFFDTSIWAFLPLILLLVGSGIFLARELGWLQSSGIPPAKFAEWPTKYAPISIVGKTFKNEKVLLDGYSYSSCEFDNVTFVYNGTTAVQLFNSKINGAWLASDNPSVSGSFALLRGLGFIKEGIRFEIPPGNVIEPPKVPSTSPLPTPAPPNKPAEK